MVEETGQIVKIGSLGNRARGPSDGHLVTEKGDKQEHND
jgi:hypothetical protein